MRACVIETHVKISQEPFDTEIYRENAAPQNESRTQTNTLREPVQSKRMSKYQKSYFLRKFTGKKSASLRSRATLCGNLQVKCRRPKPRCTLCASLRGRNAMKRMSKCQKSYFLRKFTGKKSASLRSRATLCGNLQVKCRRPKPRCTLCASLRGRNAMKRMSKCQKSYRKNAAAQSEHPDQAPAFTLTVRIPQCGHSVWGKTQDPWTDDQQSK